jgi:hypothetical protein
VVLLFYALAELHRRLGAHVQDLATNRAILLTAASLFTLTLVSSEIDAFWSVRGGGTAWSLTRESLQAIAWASAGAFLFWRGLSAGRRWVRFIGLGVLSVGIARLLAAQLSSAPASYIVVVNARVVAGIVTIGLLYGLARLYEQGPAAAASGSRTAFLVVANVIALTLLTSEITAYWHLDDLRQTTRLSATNSHFAREVMLSVTWALYATALIVVGLRKHYAPIRYFAMALFVVTIVKVFTIDLAELDQVYRILSVVGLGIALLMSSYLYQRFRLTEEGT